MKLPRPQLPEPWCRLPLVSLGLAATWLVFALVVQLGFATLLRDAEQQLRSAARFAIQHPEVKVQPRLLPVARRLMPSFESNEMFDFLRGKSAAAQAQFDELSAAALATADAHPQRVLGLVPAALAAHAFATHVLVHAGWVHAAASLLLLLLTGPLLERLWGRRVFGAALCAWTLVGAGAYVAVHLGADRELLGGFALVTGCVAAVATRFRGQEVDFLGWLSPWVAAELSAPAWGILALWALAEGLLAWAVPGGLPGLDPAVGWTAHAASAVVAAGAAFGIERLGWEERFGTAARELVKDDSDGDTHRFERVRAALRRGDRAAALHMLEVQVQRSPGHRDAVTLWFSLCVEQGEPERAAGALAHLVREELRRGAEDVALAQWEELVTQVPEAPVDPATWLRLVAVARRAGANETAATLLQAVVDAEPAPAVAAQAALLAAETAPELALKAASRALAGEGLPPGRRAELQALVERFAPSDPGAPAQDRERKPADPPPSVFYLESDRSEFGEVSDLSAIDDFPNGVVREALPLRLGESGLCVQLEGGETAEIRFERVRGVAMAGVHGLGPRPVVLVDLLLDGGGAERALSVLRLRSDRFDPRRLVEAQSDPLEALRALVARLLAAGGGLPLPDAEGAAGRPVRVFPELDAYHVDVLRRGAEKLA